MTTTIEHQAALARVEEMRRYAEARRCFDRVSARSRPRRRPRAALATAARRLRLA